MDTIIGHPARADERAIRELSKVLSFDHAAIKEQLDRVTSKQFRDPASPYARLCFSAALSRYVNTITLAHRTVREQPLGTDHIAQSFEDFLFFPIDAAKADVEQLERQVHKALVDHPVATLAALQALQTTPLALEHTTPTYMGYRDILGAFQSDFNEIDLRIKNIEHAFVDPPHYLMTVRSRLFLISDLLAQAYDRARHIALLNSDAERSKQLVVLHKLLVNNVDPLHNIATGFPRVQITKTAHFWKISKPFQTRAALRSIMERTFQPERSNGRRMSISLLSPTSSGTIIAILIEAPDEASDALGEALMHYVNGTRLADDLWPILNYGAEGIEIGYETLDETKALLKMTVHADTLDDVLHDLSMYEDTASMPSLSELGRAPTLESLPVAMESTDTQVIPTDSPLVASVLAYTGSEPLLSWTMTTSSLNPLKKL